MLGPLLGEDLYNQIDDMIDRIWHSSILDVLYFSGGHNFYMERCNFKNLSVVEVQELYHVKCGTCMQF